MHRVRLALTLLVMGQAGLGYDFFRVMSSVAHLTQLIWPSIFVMLNTTGVKRLVSKVEVWIEL